MYNKNDVLRFIYSGQNLTTAFLGNNTYPLELGETIVAMANTYGGIILLGVNKDGSIEGIKSISNTYMIIKEASEELSSPVIKFELQTVRMQDKDVIILQIPMAETDKFYLSSGRAFVRSEHNNVLLNKKEIYMFSMKRDVLKYESLVNERARLSDIDFEMVDRYRQDIEEKLGIKINPSAIDILQSYGCIIKDKAKMSLNNGAVLLFSKTPQKFFPHSMITCVDFRNKDILRKDIYGNLFNLVNNTLSFLIESLLKGNSYIKSILSNVESSEKLIFIIREFLINAISHRDYSIYGERTFIFIFDEYIEIVNPGSLITFDLKEKSFTRKPRNIIIHSVLTGMYYDGYHISGRNMINHFCKEIELRQVEFSYIDGHFKSILWLKPSDNMNKEKYDTTEIPYIYIPQKEEPEYDGEFTEDELTEECDGEFTPEELIEEFDEEFVDAELLIEEECDGEFSEVDIPQDAVIDKDMPVSDASGKNKEIPEKNESSGNISQREKGVIDYLRKNSSITRIECEELLKIEPRTANRVLKALVEKGLLVKEGSGTNFYYVLVK